MSKERPPYQLHLGEEGEKLSDLFYFSEGVVIWPERGSRGVLREGVYAQKTKMKVQGLTGFKALGRIDLYLDSKYWSLPEGTIFGAYAKNAKKVSLKSKK